MLIKFVKLKKKINVTDRTCDYQKGNPKITNFEVELKSTEYKQDGATFNANQICYIAKNCP